MIHMNLKAQRDAAVKAARAIIDAAKADGDRELTADEQTKVEQHVAEVKALDVKIKQADLVAGVLSLGGTPSDDDGPVARTLGDHFAQYAGKDGLARLKSSGGFTIATPEWLPPGLRLDGQKAANDPQLTTGAVWQPVLTTLDQTIVQGYRARTVVADLLSSGQMAGQAITYFVEGPVEGGFANVAEGAQKPQMHFGDPTTVTDSARKIAAWFDMSDEMVEDLPFYVSEINNRARYLLDTYEEQQLLNGDGLGNNIRGLLNRSGVQTEAAADNTDAPDALFRAMTAVQTATGLTADGVIINPLDYQTLRLARDANEQYFGGGYFAGQYGNGGVPIQPPLWGLRTVVTAAIAQGTALVGAFKPAATVYRKGGVRVESTNSDLGKFTSNIITTRIEERLALACRVPSALVKVTGFTPPIIP